MRSFDLVPGSKRGGVEADDQASLSSQPDRVRQQEVEPAREDSGSKMHRETVKFARVLTIKNSTFEVSEFREFRESTVLCISLSHLASVFVT